MSSYVDICNVGLGHNNQRSINSFNEASKEAQTCALHYKRLRDIILRATRWQFAKRTSVAQLLSAEPLDWAYAYSYPNDALKINRVVPDFFLNDQNVEGIANRSRFMDPRVQLDDPPFGLENMLISGNDTKVIGSDQSDAYLIYTKKVVDPSLFDDLFVEAYAWLIAATVAIPISGVAAGESLRNYALEMYRQTIMEAIAANGNERKRRPRKQPDQIRVRQS